MPAQNVSVSATFEPETFEISTNVIPEGAGTVELQNADSGDAKIEEPVAAGTRVKVVPTKTIETYLDNPIISVNGENGAVTVEGDTFTMPEGPVTVTVGYKSKDTATATLVNTGSATSGSKITVSSQVTVDSDSEAFNSLGSSDYSNDQWGQVAYAEFKFENASSTTPDSLEFAFTAKGGKDKARDLDVYYMPSTFPSLNDEAFKNLTTNDEGAISAITSQGKMVKENIASPAAETAYNVDITDSTALSEIWGNKEKVILGLANRNDGGYLYGKTSAKPPTLTAKYSIKATLTVKEDEAGVEGVTVLVDDEPKVSGEGGKIELTLDQGEHTYEIEKRAYDAVPKTNFVAVIGSPVEIDIPVTKANLVLDHSEVEIADKSQLQKGDAENKFITLQTGAEKQFTFNATAYTSDMIPIDAAKLAWTITNGDSNTGTFTLDKTDGAKVVVTAPNNAVKDDTATIKLTATHTNGTAEDKTITITVGDEPLDDRAPAENVAGDTPEMTTVETKSVEIDNRLAIANSIWDAQIAGGTWDTYKAHPVSFDFDFKIPADGNLSIAWGKSSSGKVGNSGPEIKFTAKDSKIAITQNLGGSKSNEEFATKTLNNDVNIDTWYRAVVGTRNEGGVLKGTFVKVYELNQSTGEIGDLVKDYSADELRYMNETEKLERYSLSITNSYVDNFYIYTPYVAAE